MKTSKILKCVSVFLAIAPVIQSLTALAAPVFGEGSGKGGGGGTGVGAAYVATAKNLVQALKSVDQKHFPTGFDLQKLNDLVNSENPVAVVALPASQMPKIGDLPRDAVSFPEIRLTMVNEDKWKKNEETQLYLLNLRLLTHEYCLILGLEGSDEFTFSAEILKLLPAGSMDAMVARTNEITLKSCTIQVAQFQSDSQFPAANSIYQMLLAKGYVFSGDSPNTSKKLTSGDLSIYLYSNNLKTVWDSGNTDGKYVFSVGIAINLAKPKSVAEGPLEIKSVFATDQDFEMNGIYFVSDEELRVMRVNSWQTFIDQYVPFCREAI